MYLIVVSVTHLTAKPNTQNLYGSFVMDNEYCGAMLLILTVPMFTPKTM